MAGHEEGEFERFVRNARPRLVRAFAAVRGDEAGEAAAEALAYAWEHWPDVRLMENPVRCTSRRMAARAPASPIPAAEKACAPSRSEK